jgi:hypothetical protein
MCGYLFASIPLAITHTIRPGYADLLVAYFLLMGIACLAFSYYRTRPIDRRVAIVLLLVAVIGCLMTKKEGAIWAGWIGLAWLANFVHHRKTITWSRILAAEGGILTLIYLLYFTTADFILKQVPMDDRVSWLFMRRFDTAAMARFAGELFAFGGFNLWWWMVAMLLAFIFFKKTDSTIKVLSIQVVLLFLALFYFACFTGNTTYTREGTNVGRFLLQLTGVMLPLYAGFVRIFLPSLQVGAETSAPFSGSS